MHYPPPQDNKPIVELATEKHKQETNEPLENHKDPIPGRLRWMPYMHGVNVYQISGVYVSRYPDGTPFYGNI